MVYNNLNKMANKGEGSIKIREFQWENFWATVDRYTEMNDQEMNFIMKYVQPNDANELWIRTFRDCISEALDFNDKGAWMITEGLALRERKDIFSTAIAAAMNRFETVAAQIREKDDLIRSDEEKKLLDVSWEENCIPYRISLDIARLLGFFRMPGTQSWIFAGRSYQMSEFCQSLYNSINVTNEKLLNPEDSEESGYCNIEDVDNFTDNDLTHSSKWKAGGIIF